MKLGKCIVCKIIAALVIVGALNWGLIAAVNLDLVAKLLGDGSVLARVVYGLVGLAGLAALMCCFKQCPCCSKGGSCETK